MTKQDKFDYIIVGAGSAGCTLAGRLTEDPSIRVLLLEAGGWDRDPWIHIPLGWGRILQKRLHDWMYFAEPSATMGGRRIECARGKVIGGSSSINAMAYYHGHPTDYDRWAATGLPGWSYADVLPYFRRSEDWEGGADTWRGAGGPLTVRKTTFEDPLCEAFLDAARDAQYPFTEDYNGEKPDGFTWMQATLRNGRRWSAAAAYLHPALKRPNLTVKTKALVERIEFDGERAIGIRYGQGGASVSVFAECEVILSGGTINSPQLLMLSGIGDPAHLRDHGIDVVMPLRGVGQNLADHTSSAFIFRRHDGGPFQRNMRFDRVVLSLARAYLGKGGFAADLPFGITGFLKTTPDVPAPDIQMLFWMGATTTASPWLPPFKKSVHRFVLGPHHADAPDQPGARCPRILPSGGRSDHPPELFRNGRRMGNHASWSQDGEGTGRVATVKSLRRRGDRARRGQTVRCGNRRPYPRDYGHRASPRGDLQDGP